MLVSERIQLPASMAAEGQEAGETYSDCGALDLSSNSSAKGHTTEEEDEGDGGMVSRGKRKMENWCAEEGRRKWARWSSSCSSNYYSDFLFEGGRMRFVGRARRIGKRSGERRRRRRRGEGGGMKKRRRGKRKRGGEKEPGSTTKGRTSKW